AAFGRARVTTTDIGVSAGAAPSAVAFARPGSKFWVTVDKPVAACEAGTASPDARITVISEAIRAKPRRHRRISYLPCRSCLVITSMGLTSTGEDRCGWLRALTRVLISCRAMTLRWIS